MNLLPRYTQKFTRCFEETEQHFPHRFYLYRMIELGILRMKIFLKYTSMFSPTVSIHHIRKEPSSTHPVESIIMRNFVSWKKKVCNLQIIGKGKYWSSDGFESWDYTSMWNNWDPPAGVNGRSSIQQLDGHIKWIQDNHINSSSLHM